MHNINRDSLNWTKMQNWFFDKILKNRRDVRSRLKPMIKNSIQNGYLYPQAEITRIDYQDALFDASRSMIRFKKPTRLIRMIDRILDGKLEVTHFSVLTYDSDKRSYALIYKKEIQVRHNPTGRMQLDLESPLIELLSKKDHNHFFENGVVIFKDLKWLLESGQLLTKDAYLHNTLRLALKEMELLNAELCVPCFFKKELLGLLILGKKTSGRNFLSEEVNLLAILANDTAMALANARLVEKLRKKMDEVEHLYEKERRLFINTAITLAKAIDARDVYTHGHTERVTKYCIAITDELGDVSEISRNSRFKELLQITALLHDIGKIGIPDSILNKKSRLTGSERKIVEKHPEIGASILFPIHELREVSRCVRLHQEWHNGNGYPDKLKKDEIPLISRIISVADTFDAITSDRPYRKKKSAKKSLEEIKRGSGTQFEPQIVKALLSAYEKKKI